MFGGYYGHDDRVMRVGIPDFGVNTSTPSEERDIGLFTDQRFAFTSRDVLDVGLRYNNTKQSMADSGETYQALTGNASLKHNFTRDLMVYASYGRSFRPGSGGTIAPMVPVPAALVNFSEETSDSFEVGGKSSFLGGKLQVDADIFYQKYKGYIGQNFSIACTGVPSKSGPGYATYDGTATGAACSFGPNANGNAVSKGAELAIRGRPLEGWTLDGTFSYAKANYTNAPIPCNDYNGDGVPDSIGVPRVQPGRYVSICDVSSDLGQLPHFTLAVTSGYEHGFGELTGFIRGQVTYQSSAYFPANQYTVPGYGLVNLFAGARSVGHGWEAQIFVKNLFNSAAIDTYGGEAYAGSADTGYAIGTVIKPREVGLNLRYAFGS